MNYEEISPQSCDHNINPTFRTDFYFAFIIKMIKKILVLLLCLSCLCACGTDSQLKKNGYSDKEIELIMELSEDTQMFFINEYNEDYIAIIKNKNFIEKNFDQYLQYYGQMDDNQLFSFINNGYIKKYGIDTLKGIMSDKYFIEKKFETYLEYANDFDNYRDLVEFVNVQRNDAYYTNERLTDLSKNYYMLVNKYNYLTYEFIPDDLVAIDENVGMGWLRQAVYEAFLELREDAIANGYSLRTVSPYRSWTSQNNLYTMYQQTDPVEVVDTYSARPGHSEHQSGLCIDVSVPGYSLDDFYKTEAATWLAENCYKYGFIIRYPQGKEDITGYQWEPWQIRYVGDIAQDVYESGITYDEYYAYYIDDANKTDKQLHDEWTNNKSINQDYVGQLRFDSNLVNVSFVQATSLYDRNGKFYEFYSEDGDKITEQEVAYACDGQCTGNDVYIWTNWKTLQYDKFGLEGGSVFVDYRNTMYDQNVIIYGHHYSRYFDTSGSKQFTPLDMLLDEDNYEDNKHLTIYLGDESRDYVVASVVEFSVYDEDGLQCLRTNFDTDLSGNSDPGYFETYKKYIKDNQEYDTGVDISSDDKLVTLVTCVYGQPDLRQIVICKQTNK